MKLGGQCFWILLVFCSIQGSSSAEEEDSNVVIWGKEDFSNNSTITSVTLTLSTTTANDTVAVWVGYVAAGISIVFFGSTYVPVKKFDTGDGMFYQWIFCSAIWLSGLVINCIQNFPQFYPLAMLGGTLFACGNICVVPIIDTIGLALGMLIWGSSNLLAGWASSRFGWFGLTPEVPPNIALNYAAISVALLSTIVWIFVKPDVSVHSMTDDLERPLVKEISEIGYDDTLTYTEILTQSSNESGNWATKFSMAQKRIIGVSLSLVSGVFYGLSFVPVLHIKANYKGASQTDMDYVFAHFCGAFATSFLFFVIYCIIKKNKPKVHPSAILPGLLSGTMWAIADASWFLANQILSAAITFPIITTGPGIIASLWGFVVFKEIKGRRNFLVIGVAYILTITAAVLAGLSKK